LKHGSGVEKLAGQLRCWPIRAASWLQVDNDGFHKPELAVDSGLATFFGSATSNELAWLEIDLGARAPYYDQLRSITVRRLLRCRAAPQPPPRPRSPS
jgi:hypothetical protein